MTSKEFITLAKFFRDEAEMATESIGEFHMTFRAVKGMMGMEILVYDPKDLKRWAETFGAEIQEKKTEDGCTYTIFGFEYDGIKFMTFADKEDFKNEKDS